MAKKTDSAPATDAPAPADANATPQGAPAVTPDIVTPADGSAPSGEFEAAAEGADGSDTPPADPDPAGEPEGMAPGHEVKDGVIYLNEPCPFCKGKGKVQCKSCGSHDKDCDKCGGTGKRRIGNAHLVMLMALRSQPHQTTGGLSVLANLSPGAATAYMAELEKHGVVTKKVGTAGLKTEWEAAI